MSFLPSPNTKVILMEQAHAVAANLTVALVAKGITNTTELAKAFNDLSISINRTLTKNYVEMTNGTEKQEEQTAQ